MGTSLRAGRERITCRREADGGLRKGVLAKVLVSSVGLETHARQNETLRICKTHTGGVFSPLPGGKPPPRASRSAELTRP